MTTGLEVLGDGTIRGAKALGVAWRFAPLHTPLPLTGGLVGILGTVIEVFVLAVFHARQDLPLRGAIALALVRDDHARDIR